MEWTAFLSDEAVAQSPVASTSTAVSTSDALEPSHPIPPMLAEKLEPYRNKQTFPAGVAFFKRWAADMLWIDPSLKGEGLTPVELATAAKEAAESYNVRTLLPMQIGKQIRDVFTSLPKTNRKTGSKGAQHEYYEKLAFRAAGPAYSPSISTHGSHFSADNSVRSSMSPFGVETPIQQHSFSPLVYSGSQGVDVEGYLAGLETFGKEGYNNVNYSL